MTDPGLIAKKLTRIEGFLADLGRIDPAGIEADVVVERFAEHTLQRAVQATIDVAAHIVADDRLGDAETNHALFYLLARHGWLPAPLVPTMHRMVGFRYLLVHGYDAVDVRIVRQTTERHAKDLLAFVAAIRAGLAARS